VKGALSGQEFDSTEEFLLTIREVMDSISLAEVESVFDEWEWRLNKCVHMGGEYIT
jgi:hypothetical protein